MTYKCISDMTPTEFERCCLDILPGYAEEEHLNGFEITHNKIIKAPDGRYQIASMQKTINELTKTIARLEEKTE